MDRRPLLQQLVGGPLGAELALERLRGLAAPLGVRAAGARLGGRAGAPARVRPRGGSPKRLRLGRGALAGHAPSDRAGRRSPRRRRWPPPRSPPRGRAAGRPGRPGRRPRRPGRSPRRAAPAARPRTTPGARRAGRRARGRCGSRARRASCAPRARPPPARPAARPPAAAPRAAASPGRNTCRGAPSESRSSSSRIERALAPRLGPQRARAVLARCRACGGSGAGRRPPARRTPPARGRAPPARSQMRSIDGRVVGDEHERRAGRHPLGDQREALALERLVADGEDLVDQQHVGVEVGDDREAEPQEHARAVGLDRHVDEVAELGEVDDRVDPLLDLLAREAVQRAVQQDVLAAGEVLAEAGAELEQRRDPAAALGPARVERHDAGEAAQRRGLAGAVAAHDAHRLARRAPAATRRRSAWTRCARRWPRGHEQLLERARPLVGERERARGAARARSRRAPGRGAHRTTARSRSMRRKASGRARARRGRRPRGTRAGRAPGAAPE